MTSNDTKQKIIIVDPDGAPIKTDLMIKSELSILKDKNTLWTLSSERVHATRLKSAFTCGKQPFVMGGGKTLLQLILSAVIAILVSKESFFFLLFYLVLITSYSLFFKRIVLIDIIIQKSLHITKIVADTFISNISLNKSASTKYNQNTYINSLNTSITTNTSDDVEASNYDFNLIQFITTYLRKSI